MSVNAPKLRSAFLALSMLAVVAVLVAGCGRKGPPEPPPGADYPRQYPSR